MSYDLSFFFFANSSNSVLGELLCKQTAYIPSLWLILIISSFGGMADLQFGTINSPIVPTALWGWQKPGEHGATLHMTSVSVDDSTMCRTFWC